MWEGFDGHPLRKDWKEAFFEEETKPFKSRWPDGKHFFSEEKNPFRDNLSFPADFDPEAYNLKMKMTCMHPLKNSGQRAKTTG
jgi:NADH-quinone oxidoreductase subunit C/D